MSHDRRTYTEEVYTYLLERPGQWVDGLTLAGLGGAYAWRTRVSEARTIARAVGADIENRLRTAPGDDRTVSEYRYVPGPLVPAEPRVREETIPRIVVPVPPGRLF